MTRENNPRDRLNSHQSPVFVILILLVCALLLGSCQIFPITDDTLPGITDPGYSIRPTTSDTISQPSDPSTVSRPTTQPTTLETTASAISFEEQVARALSSGLSQGSQSINLDAVIKPQNIPESDVQAAIDRVFSVYQQIFADNPQFFYLNGSINVSYQVDSAQKRLIAMTVKPEKWPEMTGLSAAKLDVMADEIAGLTRQVASDVSSRTQEPWEQLAAIHDFLIRHIAYDEGLDQNNNHVYSALFRKISLCQGYAQSFQLIARELGFEIKLITGESDGLGHAWNLVRLDGQWYHIDATFDDPTPDRGPTDPIQYVHFLRSDAVMRSTHIWNHANWPASPADGAHYFYRQNLTAASQDELNVKLIEFISSIDFDHLQVNRLQLLYTGPNQPTREQLDELVRQTLRREAAGMTVYYSTQIIKGVVLIDITAEA